MTPETTNLPAGIDSDLALFLQKSKDAIASNLVSVYLFGGLAKEEFDSNSSDVNVMLILKETSPTLLDAVNKALEDPNYKIVLAPFILTESELNNAADLFPVKFLDIKNNHILLFGPDLMNNIQINNDLLKRNTRRELKNILFRLNQIYIHNNKYPEILGNRMRQLVPGLLIHINVISFLKNNQLYKTKEQIIEQAAKQLGIDHSFLLELFEYKKKQRSILNPDMTIWYGKFMELVKNVSSKADSL